uniref:Uncharacterized protein n=1 Tax=Myotis myotis TaxID=51298 RepID=A0A7J7ZWI0_MYOMY|nr:hypothetical protein mMyoMyo1_009588 [Myotis myotis]
MAQLFSLCTFPSLIQIDTPKFSGCCVLKNNFLTLNILNYIHFPEAIPYPQFAPNVRVSKNGLPVASLLDVFPEVKPSQAQVLAGVSERGRPWAGMWAVMGEPCSRSPLLRPRLIAGSLKS